MNYELAKKLKDAGFSQEGKGFNINEYGMPAVVVLNSNVYVPTLSELIEACGEGFGLLLRTSKEDWCAGNSCDKNGEIREPRGLGSTPEEAVAKLWLELNKNANN